MEKYSRIKFIAFIYIFISANVYGQFNLNTNVFSADNYPLNQMPAQQDASPVLTQAGGFPCIPNTFYATSSTVDQYMITGNTATFVSIICPPYLYSLAYCNNLNGGSFSPTFYDCIDSAAVYFDGSGWVQIPLQGPGRLFNCGGNGSYLYYCVAPATSLVNAIARYDGSTFTTIYNLSDPNKFISVADLNIDDDGNVWFFTGHGSPASADTLNVISPAGQLLKQFPFSFNTQNAYGSFMMNGIIYIGLGSANTVYPNTLLPVIIGFNSVTMGTPVPMPSTINYGDLASCNAGNPLSVKEYPRQENFSLFPNPTNDVLTITSNGWLENEYKIVDINGRKMQTISSMSPTIKTDIHSLKSGIYFIESKNSTGIWRKKFVKL
jgi:hypothetical protein